jgi:hypothetical protein
MDPTATRGRSVPRAHAVYPATPGLARAHPEKPEQMASPEDLALEASFPELPYDQWPPEADAETWEPGAWWAGCRPVAPGRRQLEASLSRLPRRKGGR